MSLDLSDLTDLRISLAGGLQSMAGCCRTKDVIRRYLGRRKKQGRGLFEWQSVPIGLLVGRAVA